MWRFIFIGVTVLLLYLSYGVASHGGPWAFFAGAAAGCVVTYLFMRYKSEAAANVNMNTQSVNVSVSQAQVDTVGKMTRADLVQTILEVMDNQKLLVEHVRPAELPKAETEPTLAELLARQRGYR